MIRALLVGLLCWLGIAGPALAIDLPTGPLPLHVPVDVTLRPTDTAMLVVRGRVQGDGAVTIVLRIDDDWSDSYAGRVNIERRVPPGSFRWEIPLRGLKTSGGRPLRFEAVREIHLFNASSHGDTAVDVFRVEDAPSLPRGTAGYSLGGAQAPLFAGFQRIAPGDERILAGRPTAVLRPGVDPLIASGLRGVERLAVPWTGQRASVTLWLEDVGEWETLPHPLRRRVRVNGIDVLDETLSGVQWIDRRYFRGQANEFQPGADSWQAYGRLRGDQVTVEVPVGPAGIVVELAGDSPAATYLGAILIEPAGSTTALTQVTRRRHDWFVNAWPVGIPPLPEMLPTIAVGDSPSQPLSAAVVPGTGQRIEFRIEAETAATAAPFDVTFDGDAARFLRTMLWSSQWRLARESTGGNLLRLDDRTLRAGLHLDAKTASAARRQILWVSADATAPPGRYRGNLSFRNGNTTTRVPLEVEILPVELPPAPKPAGFYLEPPVHLTWFPETAVNAARQLGCDEHFLTGLGINGNAPPLPEPVANREADFIGSSRQALQNETTAPWLAYSAAKRARGALGEAGSAEAISSVLRHLEEKGLPGPIWSVADEPSNPDQGGTALSTWIAAIRSAAPQARLAGHLNAREDSQLLELFDVVLVNDGYGLDLNRLRAAAGASRQAWLYNTGKPRFSAGFWLWRTSASRYLQWHARMPTADPFDPTDGREGDVQALLPTQAVCSETQDIDEMVLEMAEGLVDQRWLAWLDAQPSGANLRRELRDGLGNNWRSASSLTTAEMDGIRHRIQDLARTLR